MRPIALPKKFSGFFLIVEKNLYLCRRNYNLTTMTTKIYSVPPIAWLRVTDYMHGWLDHELTGAATVDGIKVVCLQHLQGARQLLRMETVDDVAMSPQHGLGLSLSANRRTAYADGLELNKEAMEARHGVTREELALFVPVECPKVRLTQLGVLRPWTNDTVFSHTQASKLNTLLREAFWKSVKEFSDEYAAKRQGEKYAQVEMIEAWCRHTGTPDIHVDALRREWQRRVKRGLLSEK